MFQRMILLTCERLLAIKYPFKYADITRKHIMIVVGTSWLLVVAFVGLAIKFNVTQSECSIVSTVLILTARITLTTTNVIIYFIAKKHDTFMKENVQRHHKNTTKAVCVPLPFGKIWLKKCSDKLKPVYYKGYIYGIFQVNRFFILYI